MHIHRSSMKTGICSCFRLYFLSIGNLGKKKWVKREVLVIHWVFALFWQSLTYLFDSCLLKLCFSPQWSHLTRWNSGVNKLVILEKVLQHPLSTRTISQLFIILCCHQRMLKYLFLWIDLLNVLIKITKEKHAFA